MGLPRKSEPELPEGPAPGEVELQASVLVPGHPPGSAGPSWPLICRMGERRGHSDIL